MDPKKTKNTPRGFAVRLLAFALSLAGVLSFISGCRDGKDSANAGSQTQVSQISFDTLSGKVKMGESFNSITRGLGVPESESSLLLTGIKENFRFKLYAGQSYSVIFRVTVAGRELQSFVLEDRNSERRHVLARPSAPASAAPVPAVQASAVSVAAFSGAAPVPSPETPAAASAPEAAPMTGTAFAYELVDIPVRVDTVAVNGTLSSNLYDAFISQGETGALIQQVTKVFAWDVDFFKDPRTGDEFSLLVEKRYGEDGSFRGYGKILSAKYENRGREFFGILYKGSYFNQEGRSMEKMLMKAPLNFARVTSGFSASRLHPVLGVNRPHWGIDYGGPKGTKILAAGDGTVEYSKWVNGYGKTIKIRHNGVYNTYYAHLNGFASGMSAGRRVKQGEVIGYMGMTGLATGVHLDYRVEFNGRYINPASLKMESKQGVEKPEWKDFCDHRDQLLARMSTSEFKHFASAASIPSDPDTKAF